MATSNIIALQGKRIVGFLSPSPRLNTSPSQCHQCHRSFLVHSFFCLSIAINGFISNCLPRDHRRCLSFVNNANTRTNHHTMALTRHSWILTRSTKVPSPKSIPCVQQRIPFFTLPSGELPTINSQRRTLIKAKKYAIKSTTFACLPKLSSRHH